MMQTHQKLGAALKLAYTVPLGQQLLAQQQARSVHAALALLPPRASQPRQMASQFWSTAGSASCLGEQQRRCWRLQLCFGPPCMQTDHCRKLAQDSGRKMLQGCHAVLTQKKFNWLRGSLYRTADMKQHKDSKPTHCACRQYRRVLLCLSKFAAFGQVGWLMMRGMQTRVRSM